MKNSTTIVLMVFLFLTEISMAGGLGFPGSLRDHVDDVRDKLPRKPIRGGESRKYNPKGCKPPKKFRNADHPYFDGANGCGDQASSKKIRDDWKVVSFTSSCNNHDRCVSTLGRSFKDCNKRFHKDLRKACYNGLEVKLPFNNKLPPEPTTLAACYTLAAGYYAGVSSKIGKNAYRKAQELQEEYEEWYKTCDKK